MEFMDVVKNECGNVCYVAEKFIHSYIHTSTLNLYVDRRNLCFCLPAIDCLFAVRALVFVGLSFREI